MMQVIVAIRRLVVCLGFMSLFTSAVAGAATTREAVDFSLYISGIRIGSVKLQGVMTDKAYQVRGSMGGAGIGRAFVPATYSGSVSGFVKRGKLQPREFSGRFDRGRKYFTVDISYQGSRPKVVDIFPKPAKRSYDLNIRNLRNTLDPISLAFDTFRPTTKDKVCKRKQDIFEGRRLSRLTFGEPVEDEKTGEISCEGTYERVDGYPPDLMKKQTSFEFTIIYEAREDGLYQVEKFQSDTTFGLAKGVRRKKKR